MSYFPNIKIKTSDDPRSYPLTGDIVGIILSAIYTIIAIALVITGLFAGMEAGYLFFGNFAPAIPFIDAGHSIAHRLFNSLPLGDEPLLF